MTKHSKLEEVAARVETIRSTANYSQLGEIPTDAALRAISELAAAIELHLKKILG